MGLLTQAQEEVDYLERRAKVRDQQATRRVGGYNKEIAGYNSDASAKQAELAPLQEIINHYNNVQVPEYNTNLANYNNGWWNGGQLLMRHGNGSYWLTTDGTFESGGYTQASPPSDHTEYQVGANSSGSPIFRYNKYATPVAPDSSAATAADATLQSHKSSIDALNARSTSLAEKGESVMARNERERARIEREVDRFNSDIEIKQNLLKNEMTQPQQPQGSVFNETQVFQSISDWLK